MYLTMWHDPELKVNVTARLKVKSTFIPISRVIVLLEQTCTNGRVVRYLAREKNNNKIVGLLRKFYFKSC